MKGSQTVKYGARLLAATTVVGTLFSSSAFALPSVLDTAYNPITGHTYFLLDNSNWTDAANKAIQLGGNLVTINDAAENSFVYTLWGANRNLWIGLYDPIFGDSGAQHAADFRWVSQDMSGYRNWLSGEPNNANAGEYYAYIYASTVTAGGQPVGGLWNDLENVASTPNQPLLYGVVEVVPEPTCGMFIGLGLLASWGLKRKRALA